MDLKRELEVLVNLIEESIDNEDWADVRRAYDKASELMYDLDRRDDFEYDYD